MLLLYPVALPMSTIDSESFRTIRQVFTTKISLFSLGGTVSPSPQMSPKTSHSLMFVEFDGFWSDRWLQNAPMTLILHQGALLMSSVDCEHLRVIWQLCTTKIMVFITGKTMYLSFPNSLWTDHSLDLVGFDGFPRYRPKGAFSKNSSPKF